MNGKTIGLVRLLSFATVLLLAGCAGTDFVRPTPDALKNGTTTIGEARQRYGAPYREGVATHNDERVIVLSYAYATTGGTPLEAGVVPARGLELQFWKDVLISHAFISSFADDNTNFDEARRDRIIKGKSSRDEVVALMGRPSGYAIFPAIKQKSGEAAVYVYQAVRGSAFNMRFYRKALIVSFDDKGIVTEVDYTQSGSL